MSYFYFDEADKKRFISFIGAGSFPTVSLMGVKHGSVEISSKWPQDLLMVGLLYSMKYKALWGDIFDQRQKEQALNKGKQLDVF